MFEPRPPIYQRHLTTTEQKLIKKPAGRRHPPDGQGSHSHGQRDSVGLPPRVAGTPSRVGVSGVPSWCEFPALTSQCTQQPGAVFPSPSMNPHSIRRRPAEHSSLTEHVQSHSKPQRLAECLLRGRSQEIIRVYGFHPKGCSAWLKCLPRVMRGKPDHVCPAAIAQPHAKSCQQPLSSNQNSAWAK